MHSPEPATLLRNLIDLASSLIHARKKSLNLPLTLSCQFKVLAFLTLSVNKMVANVAILLTGTVVRRLPIFMRSQLLNLKCKIMKYYAHNE